MSKENIKTETIRKKRSLKYQAILELVIALALLVIVNILAGKIYTRVDFTKEKRYTLSPASKELAAKLDDILYVKVHLAGDLNPDFERLRKATKEMLDEFNVASGGQIEYEFADPLEGKTQKEKVEIIRQLQESGIQPTEIFENTDDANSRKVIVPGVTFYYKTTQYYTLNLLKQQFGQRAEQVLNSSIEGLEYEIASTLRKVVAGRRKNLVFLEGHGELSAQETADISKELENTFNVKRFNLWMNSSNEEFINQFAGGFDSASIDPEKVEYWLMDTLSKALNSFDVMVIARPTQPFSEQEKYQIDQYIMNGGKVIWMIDPLVASLDTIDKYGKVMTADYNLELTDLMFNYGARVNLDLVQDAECNKIPLGRPPQLFPWIYHPIAVAKSKHPIVNNLNPMLLQFVSTVDTVGKPSISKKILLSSSLYSRPVNHPVELSFDIVAKPVDPRLLNRPERPLAVLLEGKFTSFYKNMRGRDPNLKFVPESPQNSMVVIGDGDFIKNKVKSTGEILPAGYDNYTQRMFDNKKFFINCLDYMLDESGLIEVRSKELEIRPLNKTKVKNEKNYWKTLNMAAPVIAVIIFGLINGFIRRRKYVR